MKIWWICEYEEFNEYWSCYQCLCVRKHDYATYTGNRPAMRCQSICHLEELLLDHSSGLIQGSKWETSLQNNGVCHWLGENLESALAVTLGLGMFYSFTPEVQYVHETFWIHYSNITYEQIIWTYNYLMRVSWDVVLFCLIKEIGDLFGMSVNVS